MKTWLITVWAHVRASYWFIPSIMSALAALLSFVTTAVDRRLNIENPTEWNYIYTGGADGARELFSTVAGSMITVAGLVFSLTVLTLTLAAQQFGSRLLHNFMRDTGNQVVLGTFVSTFLYCLLVLRTVRGGEEELSFVPHTSVTVAVLLATASLAVLIYFIHHVAASINPANIIETVGRDLDRTIDHHFPAQIGRGMKATPEKSDCPAEGIPGPPHSASATPVRAASSGYVQYFDGDGVLSLARERNWVVRTRSRPGSLVVDGDTLAEIFASSSPDPHDLKQVREAFVLGGERTSSQDLIFPINQLVQMAQRALSPGINDPQTAMLCIDRLGISLARLAGRDTPSGRRCDGEGVVRLHTAPYTFPEALEASIDPVREYATSSVQVMIRLLEVLNKVAERAEDPGHREALRQQARVFEECIGAGNDFPFRDRDALSDRLRQFRQALEDTSGGNRATGP